MQFHTAVNTAFTWKGSSALRLQGKQEESVWLQSRFRFNFKL